MCVRGVSDAPFARHGKWKMSIDTTPHRPITGTYEQNRNAPFRIRKHNPPGARGGRRTALIPRSLFLIRPRAPPLPVNRNASPILPICAALRCRASDVEGSCPHSQLSV